MHRDAGRRRDSHMTAQPGPDSPSLARVGDIPSLFLSFLYLSLFLVHFAEWFL